ncbi:uncharacterized protein F5Z01DRAFT_683469 [Emericellopsis atlantica]|uniref:Uncharacterized protein n=1 Tax=Emericellopsis atlantica TaxID=2614577 RepID=A0A9P7ZFL3_9HYPO|nr:uncharacterized protein F5Z01DRAFT_683469 [Emericellopsis atlantica]KAG9251199.1 hypothetical protein F5Z01DRAFT_683469 [Emericellopsis atlantica]
MDPFTSLYRCQIGGADIISYSYTDMPWKLLGWDIYYFFVYAWALPWVLWPMFTYGSGELDELYPTFQNLFCVFMHLILAILQLGFIIALPLTVILPVWVATGGIGAFLLGNWLLCKLLNGTGREFSSDDVFAAELPEHAHEQWVFVNGVAVGRHWFKNNLNRLALTFKRPVLGIHNETRGIIFDVFECLLQRNFSYATTDVRITYRVLKNILYDPSKSKVVLILHSQGGIEGGLVLDWLLQELPQDLLSKLEVYTFGCAANHFNNPHRHAFAQNLMKEHPRSAIHTMLTETSFASEPLVDGQSDMNAKDPGQESTLSRENSLSSSRTMSVSKDRAIGHIEHYAHSTDFVAIWGVLHFATNRTNSPQIPRFLGRLFVQSTGGGGHQLNQHYLDGMFPLKRNDKGEFTGVEEENNEFMNEVVRLGEEGAAMKNIREAFDITYAGTDGFGTGESSEPVEVHGVEHGKRSIVKRKEVRVKDLSRLWLYRDGKSPKGEMPPMLVGEYGVARNATM